MVSIPQYYAGLGCINDDGLVAGRRLGWVGLYAAAMLYLASRQPSGGHETC